MSENINTDELYRLLRSLDHRFEKIETSASAILVQTTRTNGRVTTCENEIRTLRATTARVVWTLITAISTGVIGGAITLAFRLFISAASK